MHIGSRFMRVYNEGVVMPKSFQLGRVVLLNTRFLSIDRWYRAKALHCYYVRFELIVASQLVA